MTALMTLFKSDRAVGKRFELGDDGRLVKTTVGNLVAGTFEVVQIADVAALVRLLQTIKSGEALSASTPVGSVPESGRLAVKDKPVPGAFARTRDNFNFRNGSPGVLTLDYDPPEGATALSCDDLWALLRDTVPGVADAGVVWWSSASSHICVGERDLTGLRGQRLYILVGDAGDIPRACTVLGQRLWLAGLGRVQISAAGSLLLRHVFDDALARPAQLDFAGGALLNAPLVQRRGAPVVLGRGGFLDTHESLRDLSGKDLQRLESMQADAKEVAEPEARVVREARTLSNATDIARRLMAGGVAAVEAHDRGMQAARALFGGELLGDFRVTLDDGELVSVGDVLDDRERYHGRLTRDPLEPEYCGGKVTGKLYLYGVVPNLHSFAHGGGTYRLRRQPARLFLVNGRRAESAVEVARSLARDGDLLRFGGLLVRVTATGLEPVQSPAGLAFIAGCRLALFRNNGKHDMPADLDDQTARMILEAA